MRSEEQNVIDHSVALIKSLTTCLRPVFKENKFFMMVSIGYGDSQIKVSFDKQVVKEFDHDNIKMSLYAMALGLTLESFTQGKLPGLVDEWKQIEEGLPEEERPTDITFSSDELWGLVYKAAQDEPESLFKESMDKMGLFITETER